MVVSEVELDTTKSPISSPPWVLLSTCSIVFSETVSSVDDSWVVDDVGITGDVSVVSTGSVDSPALVTSPESDSSLDIGLSVDPVVSESIASSLVSN